MSPPREAAARLVIVTGPSGAGRTTAIAALEDLGFETIDNIPLGLLPQLVDGPAPDHPVAVGVSTRTREFSAGGLADLIDRLRDADDVALDLLYLDCREEVLLTRYSATRRRHPLAPSEAPVDGIAREVDLLAPIRDRADTIVDTSDNTPHETRAEIARWFGHEGGARLAVRVHSFSYKRGLPRGADMVFDVRFLRNPHWQADLRALDGRDARVARHIEGDARFAPTFARIRDLILDLLPAYRGEGKAHLSIAFGCTGGQHRSVLVAERLAAALAEAGWQVSKRHWELERRGRVPVAPEG